LKKQPNFPNFIFLAIGGNLSLSYQSLFNIQIFNILFFRFHHFSTSFGFAASIFAKACQYS